MGQKFFEYFRLILVLAGFRVGGGFQPVGKCPSPWHLTSDSGSLQPALFCMLSCLIVNDVLHAMSAADCADDHHPRQHRRMCQMPAFEEINCQVIILSVFKPA